MRAASMWGQGNARIRLMDAYAEQIGERLDEIEDAEDVIQRAATARVDGAIAMLAADPNIDIAFRQAVQDYVEALENDEA